MKRLRARVRECWQLSAQDVARMYALFDCYYEGGSRGLFESDLACKSHVIELHDDTQLRGFSTLEVFGIGQHSGHARGIFSGDTIIHHESWGEQALALCFCEFAGAIKAQVPTEPLYWLLISKGYRTYRYLHLFARHYFPTYRQPTPDAAKILLDSMCISRFADCYDAASGVIRMGAAAGTRLRPEWCGVRANLLHLPEVAFFLKRNPNFSQGDELACICELDASNLRSFALRAFTRGMSQRRGDITNAI